MIIIFKNRGIMHKIQDFYPEGIKVLYFTGDYCQFCVKFFKIPERYSMLPLVKKA